MFNCDSGERVLTEPVDITDPAIAKAYAHPLRVEILGLLENRVASPRQLATELNAGLSTTSYHVRQLAGLRLIKLVKRRMRRGAVEHYYTAAVRPTITDAGWANVPTIVKQALVGSKIAQAGKEIARAAGEGGFDREDVHFSRTRLRLVPETWARASEILERALEELDALGTESRALIEQDPGVEVLEATALMMFFETRIPFGQADGLSADDDMEDLTGADRPGSSGGRKPSATST